jgi:hypothetical protein
MDGSLDRLAAGIFGDIAYSPVADCFQLTQVEPGAGKAKKL